jgi:hypothetical protein
MAIPANHTIGSSRSLDITQHVHQMKVAHATNPIEVQKTIHAILKDLAENLKVAPSWVDVWPQGSLASVPLETYVKQLIKNNDLPGAKALGDKIKGNREAMIPIASVNAGRIKQGAKEAPSRIPIMLGNSNAAIKEPTINQFGGAVVQVNANSDTFQKTQKMDKSFSAGEVASQDPEISDEASAVCLKRMNYLV